MMTSVLTRAARPLVAFAALLVSLTASGQNWEWATAPEHTASEQRYRSLMAVDRAGNQYIAGSFKGSLQLGSTTLAQEGDEDIYVGKRTAAGQWVWAVRVGSKGGERASGIAIDSSGGVRLTGHFYGSQLMVGTTVLPGTPSSWYPSGYAPTGFVARLSSAGVFQWAVRMVATGNNGFGALAVDRTGAAYVAGGFSGQSATLGTISLSRPGSFDGAMFVAKLSAAGVWQWATMPGYSSSGGGGGAHALTLDRAGNVYITGRLWGSSGNGLAFGPSTVAGSDNVFVAKLNGAGAWQWAVAPVNGSTQGEDIAVDANGASYVLGRIRAFSGTSFGSTSLQQDGLFIAQVTPAGRWGWATQAAGWIHTYNSCLELDGTRAVQIVTSFRDTLRCGSNRVSSTGGVDLLVGKLSTATGAWLQVIRGGGKNDDYIQDFGIDAATTRYVLGTFNMATTLGATTLASPSRGFDGFISRLTSRGIWQGATRIGGEGGDNEVLGTCRDAAGNVYATGYFQGAVQFGSTTLVSTANQPDVFVAKLSSAGAWLWAVRVGGSGPDQGNGIGIDAGGNLYVAGSFSGTAAFGSTTLVSAGGTDAFVGRLTAAGAWQWAVRAGGTGADLGQALAVRGTNVRLLGTYASPVLTCGSTTLTNAGGKDLFVGRLTTAGVWQGAVTAGGRADEVAGGIVLDAAGTAYLTGSYSYNFNNYGAPQFGSITLPRWGSSDAFVARLSAAGAWQWAVRGGATTSSSSGYDGTYGRAIALDAAGSNLYVVGGFAGQTAQFGSHVVTNSTPDVDLYVQPDNQQDLFVAKLTAGTGAWQWARSAGAGGPAQIHTGSGEYFGPDAKDVATAVVVDGSGRVVVAGYSISPVYAATFGSQVLQADLFVARLTASGVWQWAVGARTGWPEESYYYTPTKDLDPLPCLSLDPGGNAYVGGGFRHPGVRFGADSVSGSGFGFTAFVAKVNPALAPTAALVPGPETVEAGLEAGETGLGLAPNPARGTVRVWVEEPGEEEAGRIVTVLDSRGNQVLRRELAAGVGETMLDVGQLPAGLYVVRVMGGGRAVTGRLVVGE